MIFSVSAWTAEEEGKMELEIIPSQNAPLDFDAGAIKIQYIEYCSADGHESRSASGGIFYQNRQAEHEY